jgi:hypothetical protein
MGTFMSKHAANLLNINPIDNKASAINMLGDVNNDGIMSDWETARKEAIDKNS